MVSLFQSKDISVNSCSSSDNNGDISFDQLLLNPLYGLVLDTNVSNDKLSRSRSSSSLTMPLEEEEDMTVAHGPLHESTDEDETSCDSISENETTSTTKEQRLVRFSSFNEVRYIPSHRDLSEEERQRIWTTEEEGIAAVRQNINQYHFEGLDWQNVIEEEDFILCSDGRFYHPADVYQHLQLLQMGKRCATASLCENQQESSRNGMRIIRAAEAMEGHRIAARAG